MNDTSTNGNDHCPKCEREGVEVVDVEGSDDFDHDEVCGFCIRDHGRAVAREGKRGKGQRPLGEQNAVNRYTRYPSSNEVGRERSDTETEQ